MAKKKIRKEKLDLLKLIVSIAISISAGLLGSLATSPSIPTWYASLNKTILTPPSWIFGPVWTTLYVLMGIAFYFVWSKGFKKPEIKNAAVLFFAQLVLNSVWSLIFFGLHQMLMAFFEMLILWAVILMTIRAFKSIDKRAYYLMVPYLIWVTFAAVLNFATWLANI